MSKEILLMADVKNLGSEGDIVTVADGYARNYLLPRKLAAPVTEATRRRLDKIRRLREEKRIGDLDAARKEAATLANASCTLTVKTGEDERLYGSVTADDIIKALQEQGVHIDKHSLMLEQPIKDLGVFDLQVKLHPEVETSIKVWVVEE